MNEGKENVWESHRMKTNVECAKVRKEWSANEMKNEQTAQQKWENAPTQELSVVTSFWIRLFNIKCSSHVHGKTHSLAHSFSRFHSLFLSHSQIYRYIKAHIAHILENLIHATWIHERPESKYEIKLNWFWYPTISFTDSFPLLQRPLSQNAFSNLIKLLFVLFGFSPSSFCVCTVPALIVTIGPLIAL